MSRGVRVADRIRELSRLFRCGPRGDRIAGDVGDVRLICQHSAQGPPVVQFAGQSLRLGKIRPCGDAVVRRRVTASHQCASQQSLIVEFPGDGQGLLGMLHPACSTKGRIQGRAVRERTGQDGGCDLIGGLDSAVEHGAEPSDPFAGATPGEPQRLQRRGDSQREFYVGVLEAPAERGSEIVDLLFRLLHSLFVQGSRRPDRGRPCGVVVTVPSSNGIGFA